MSMVKSRKQKYTQLHLTHIHTHNGALHIWHMTVALCGIDGLMEMRINPQCCAEVMCGNS